MLIGSESKTVSVVLNIGSTLAELNLTEKNVGLKLGVLKEEIYVNLRMQLILCLV